MSQLTSLAPDSPDRHGRLRIWDRFRRAVQEMSFAPVSSELQMVAFSPYYPAGPACSDLALGDSQGRVPRCHQKRGKHHPSRTSARNGDDRRLPAR